MSAEVLDAGYCDLSHGERFTGMSKDTLRRLVSQGKLNGYRPGHKLLLSIAELRRFMESSRQPESAA
jgi:excisionase family DNA binding protein